MPDERPQIPPPRFAVREFNTPNFADGFYSEVFKRTDPAYLALQVPKRGAIYSTIQGAKQEVIAAFPNLYFLRESRLGTSHEFVVWLWGTDPAAEDTYNAAVEYTNAALNCPEFTRICTIRRDVYDANPTPLTIGVPLSGLVGAKVTAGGTAYTAQTVIAFSGGGGSGATGTPVISGGVIVSIIITNEGHDYTSAPTIGITDAGGGSGGAATALLQPQTAILLDQKKQEFPDDHPLRNEYVRVVRRYETLPGPVLTGTQIASDGKVIEGDTQKVAAGSVTSGEAASSPGSWTQTTEKPTDNAAVQLKAQQIRPVPGNTIPETSIREAGDVLTTDSTLDAVGNIASGESIVGSALLQKTRKPEPGSNVVANQIEGSTTLPGHTQTANVIESAGNVAAVTNKLIDATTKAVGESITGGAFLQKSFTPKPDSALAGQQLQKSLTVPGNTQTSVELGQAANPVAVAATLIDATTKAVGESIASGHLLQKSFEILPNSSVAGNQIQKDTTLPGNTQQSVEIAQAGNPATTSTTLIDAATKATGESITGGALVQKSFEARPDSALAGNQMARSITVPGATQTAVELGAAGNVTTMGSTLIDASTKASGESIVGSALVQKSFAPIPNSSVAGNQIERDTSLPGNTALRKSVDLDGKQVTTGQQLNDASAVSATEVLTGGTLTITELDPIPSSAAAGNKVAVSRAVPGDWFYEKSDLDPADAAPLFFQRRLQDSTAIIEGEGDVPPNFATLFVVNAISVAGSTTITLTANHGLSVNMWAQFLLTNSTPPLPPSVQITAVPAANQVTIAFTVTGAGTSGTMQPMWPRTTRVRAEKGKKTAFEEVRTRTLPGPVRPSKPRIDSDKGVWSVTRQLTEIIAAEAAAGESGTSTVTVTTARDFENSVKVAWINAESRTLPGNIITSSAPFGTTGIPILSAFQKVSDSVVFQQGEFLPAAINVSTISTGASPLVALASDHGLPVGAYVTFAGTASTPPLGTTPLRIMSVPATNQVTVTPASPVMVAGGTSGTMQSTNWISREIKPTEFGSIKMKVDSTIALPDVSVYNEDVVCWKDYAYPDFAESFKLFIDQSNNRSNTTQGAFALAVSTSGSPSVPIQAGYHGGSRARRQKFYFSGPPPASFLGGTTVTITIASPGVVTWTAHPLAVGDVVTFSTTGALPTGLSSTLNYYVSLTGFSTNSFQVAVTRAAALAGTGSIVTTGSQSGVQTGYQFAPTFIMLSEGTISIEGLTLSISTNPSGGGIARGHSNNWRNQNVGPFLTGPSPALVTILPDGSVYTPAAIASVAITGSQASNIEPKITTATPHGFQVNTGGFDTVIFRGTGTTPTLDGTYTVAGVLSTTEFNVIPGFTLTSGSGAAGTAAIGNQAQGTLDIPESIPPKLNQGDILTLVDPPDKASVGVLWFFQVWRLTIPYTSGQAPT